MSRFVGTYWGYIGHVKTVENQIVDNKPESYMETVGHPQRLTALGVLYARAPLTHSNTQGIRNYRGSSMKDKEI